MSLRAFLKSLDALVDDEGTVVLDSAAGDQAAGLTLSLRLRRTERSRMRRWRVSCEGLFDHHLVLGSVRGDAGLYPEHPLLWPRHSAEWQLFFRGPAADPYRAIGGLYEAHRDVAQRWFPFDRFFNPLLRLTELLRSSGGKLASGPHPLLSAYAQVLEREGVSHSLFPTTRPQFSKEAPQVLLLGKSYVVARRFAAEREEPTPTSTTLP